MKVNLICCTLQDNLNMGIGRTFINLTMAKQAPQQLSPKSKLNHSSISYSDNILSEDYISQFLYPKTTNFQNQNFPKNDFQPHSLLSPSDHHLKSLEEGSIEEEKLTSSFHNFQKHLVTTLRKCLSFAQLIQANRLGEIEKILWNFFMRCPKMTRTLIYLVFGGLSLECSKIKKFNRKYGLQKLIKSYSQTEIKKAQKNIRTQTLSQLREINIKWEIDQRRMRDKEGFRVYFEAFVEQLKSGGFNKRLPKQKKQLVKEKLGKQNKRDKPESQMQFLARQPQPPQSANNFQ